MLASSKARTGSLMPHRCRPCAWCTLARHNDEAVPFEQECRHSRVAGCCVVYCGLWPSQYGTFGISGQSGDGDDGGDSKGDNGRCWQ